MKAEVKKPKKKAKKVTHLKLEFPEDDKEVDELCVNKT